MRYAEVTFKVIFEHGDSVPASLAAVSLATHTFYRGNVVHIEIDEDTLSSLDEAQVIEAMGGCGNCEACRLNHDELALRSVMEGSALAQMMGTAGPGAVAAEQDAITRAQQHTI